MEGYAAGNAGSGEGVGGLTPPTLFTDSHWGCVGGVTPPTGGVWGPPPRICSKIIPYFLQSEVFCDHFRDISQKLFS